MHTLAAHLLLPGISVGEKLIRTVAVYLFLLVGLRLGGKRELGQLNPFDLAVLLLLANTVQNAIIGNDNSLIGGIVGAAMLLVINYLVVRYLFRHPTVERLLGGDPDVLIAEGRVLDHRLERELITPAELQAAARRQGIDRLQDVQTCRLEVGGALTFIPKHPTVEEDRFMALMRRLDELDGRLQAMQGGGEGAA